MFVNQRFSLFRRSDPVGYRSKHDSCLDQIEEAYNNDECLSGGGKYSKSNSNRRFTMTMASSRSSLMDISKPQPSSSKRFLAFFQKGIQGSRSKSINKLDNPNLIKIVNEKKYLEALNEVVPIPIRETAIQGHSKILFHKIPKSNVRPRPLLKLGEETKFVLIHPSLLARNFHHCVKIVSLSPSIYRNCSSGNQYELLLPTGTRSLGHTCQIIGSKKLQEQCPTCNSSRISLFAPEEQQNHLLAYVFSCSSESERKKWLSVLTRVVRPNLQNERRQEISLNLWIQEAKNVPLKKRYFCEIYLDETLHAKTTTKTMTDLLFWGEEFNLCHLEQVSTVTILLWKASSDNRTKKKKSQQHLICQVNIETKDISDRNNVERWYPASCSYNSNGTEIVHSNMSQSIISSTDSTQTSTLQSMQSTNLSHSTASLSNNDHLPMIRIKARYQNIDVLPINQYSHLLEFLKQHAVQLLQEMDFYLKVKNKEDLATSLINILHKQGIAVEFLSDLLFQEIKKSDDENMILRGNTIASKAIEVYLKLIGEKYLSLILSDFVNRICEGDEDCEVDPQRSKCDSYTNCSLNECQSLEHGEKSNHSNPILLQRQECLMMNVDMIWAKILSSSIYFPRELKSVFVSLRSRLEQMDQMANQMNNSQFNLYERIVSSCIFLRFICPAILTPSLFGLLPEYPDNPKVLRTFTLVAKCIQSLANFSDLTGSKESYMLFMNTFIENKLTTMQSFLKEISSLSADENNRSKGNGSISNDGTNENGLYWENLSSTLSLDSIDISLCLAQLHRQFEEYLQMIPVHKYSDNIQMLMNIITDINGRLSAKSAANEPIGVKSSQSYHQIKTNGKYGVEALQKDCNDICGTLTRHSETDQSQRTSPIHGYIDRDSISGNYLMTQSMIQDHNDSYSHIPQPDNIYRDQVDKEWKEMVSESNHYHKIVNVNDKKKSQIEKLHEMSSNPSGCETLNHSNCKISSNADEIDFYEKLPLSPSVFRQSVKKCKQFRRKIEVAPNYDASDDGYYRREQLIALGRKFRSSSIDEMSNPAFYHCMSTPTEPIDNGSTETITSNAESRFNGNKHLMNTSTSLPSFQIRDSNHDFSHSFTDINVGISVEHNDNKMKIKMNPERYMRTVANDIEAASSQSKEKLLKMPPNFNYNSDTTLQQLLLADQKTVELELERVRLIKQICDTAAKSNAKFASSAMEEQKHFIQQHNINRFKEVSQLNSYNQLSVKRYLEIAENILMNCQRNQIPKDCNFQEKENLIIQIFEINQSLQNALIKNMKGFIFSSESERSDKYPSYAPGAYNSGNVTSRILTNKMVTTISSASGNINQTSPSKPFPLNNGDSGPPPSAIIEIIDAI